MGAWRVCGVVWVGAVEWVAWRGQCGAVWIFVECWCLAWWWAQCGALLGTVCGVMCGSWYVGRSGVCGCCLCYVFVRCRASVGVLAGCLFRWVRCVLFVAWCLGPLPCVLCPVPWALCPGRCALCLVPSALCPVPCAHCPVPRALCPVPRALYSVFKARPSSRLVLM